MKILIIITVFIITSCGNSINIPDIPTPSYDGPELVMASRGGLIRSRDFGLSWQHQKVEANELNVFPENYGIAPSMVDHKKGVISLSVSGGLMISLDNGSSWQSFGPDNTPLVDSHVYSTAIYNEKVLVGTRDGLFITNDRGTTWSQSLTLNSAFRKSMISDIKVFDDEILAATSTGLARSSNGGATWDILIPPHVNDQYHWFYSLDKKDDLIVVGTTRGIIFVSENNGLTWTQNNTGLDDIIFDIHLSEDKIFIGQQRGGLIISEDKGVSFTKINSSNTPTFPRGNSVSAIYIDGNNYFIGTRNTGIGVSRDAGKTWSVFRDTSDNTYIWGITGLYKVD